MAKTINAILNLQDKFTPKLSAAQKQTLVFKAQMKDCDAVSRTFDKSLSNIGNAAKKGFAIAGTAAAGFAASSVNVYKGFEQSMSNVAGTLAIDKTSAEYAVLEKAARDAGKVTTKTATEAADALNYMALAGWSVEDSTKGLMPMLRASEAANADLGTVSDLVTDSMSALGLQVDDMNHYLDVGSKAQSKSNMNLLQFQEAMIGVGGTFKTFNTGMEEGGALLGVLANRGIKGSEAGNALQSTLINLTKKNGESAKAMDALGMSAYDSEGKFKGVTAVLKELNERTRGMTEEQRNTYLTMIGGKNQLTTLNALMSGLNTTVADGRTELEYLTDELNNSDGALDKLSTTMTDNLNGAWARFTSAIQEMQIAAGKEFAPYLQKGLDWLADKMPIVQEKVIGFIQNKLPPAIDTAKKGFEKAKPIIKWIIDHGKELAIVGGSVLAFMKGFTIANKVHKTFSAISSAAKGASIGTKLLDTAMLGLNTSFLACPVTWIVAGVVAAGAAVAFLATKSKRLRTALSGTWDIIKGFGKELGGKFLNAFNRIKNAFGESGADFEKIGDALGWLIEKANPVLDIFFKFAGAIVDMGLDVLVGGFEGIADWISAAGYALDGFKALLNGDSKSAIENFGLAGVDAFEGIGDTISGLPGPLGDVGDAIVNICDKLKILLTDGWEPFKNAVSADADTLCEKFKTMYDRLSQFWDKWNEIGMKNGGKVYDVLHNGGNLGTYYYDVLNDGGTGTKVKNGIKGFINAVNATNPAAIAGNVIGNTVKDGNALGTSYWKGGPTWVNERGGEIIDLPSGSRVIPADKSEKLVKAGNKNITINMYVSSNGNAEEVAELTARKIMDALEGV